MFELSLSTIVNALSLLSGQASEPGVKQKIVIHQAAPVETPNECSERPLNIVIKENNNHTPVWKISLKPNTRGYIDHRLVTNNMSVERERKLEDVFADTLRGEKEKDGKKVKQTEIQLNLIDKNDRAQTDNKNTKLTPSETLNQETDEIETIEKKALEKFDSLKPQEKDDLSQKNNLYIFIYNQFIVQDIDISNLDKFLDEIDKLEKTSPDQYLKLVAGAQASPNDADKLYLINYIKSKLSSTFHRTMLGMNKTPKLNRLLNHSLKNLLQHSSYKIEQFKSEDVRWISHFISSVLNTDESILEKKSYLKRLRDVLSNPAEDIRKVNLFVEFCLLVCETHYNKTKKEALLNWLLENATQSLDNFMEKTLMDGSMCESQIGGVKPTPVGINVKRTYKVENGEIYLYVKKEIPAINYLEKKLIFNNKGAITVITKPDITDCLETPEEEAMFEENMKITKHKEVYPSLVDIEAKMHIGFTETDKLASRVVQFDITSYTDQLVEPLKTVKRNISQAFLGSPLSFHSPTGSRCRGTAESPVMVSRPITPPV